MWPSCFDVRTEDRPRCNAHSDFFWLNLAFIYLFILHKSTLRFHSKNDLHFPHEASVRKNDLLKNFASNKNVSCSLSHKMERSFDSVAKGQWSCHVWAYRPLPVTSVSCNQRNFSVTDSVVQSFILSDRIVR